MVCGLDLGNGDAALQNFSEFIFLIEECLWGCEELKLGTREIQRKESLAHLEVFLDLQLFTAPLLDGMKQEPKSNSPCSAIAQLLQQVHFQMWPEQPHNH